MTPKKTTKKEAPEATIDLEAFYKDEPGTVPTPEVKPAAPARLVAYAAFEQDGEQYEAGEEFTPRKTWKRDTAFEEFRSIELKKGGKVGIAFTVPGDIIDKKTQERAYNRIVLPLKEA